jgi:hypothetical protein
MSATEFIPTEEERRYLLDRMAERLACKYAADLELLYPEMVAALLKCDVRTLEAKGLSRVELGPRNIRYRRADVEELIRKSYVNPKPTLKNGTIHRPDQRR